MRRTCAADHEPPRAAVMPRSFSFAAIPNSELVPSFCNPTITGNKSAARFDADAWRAVALAVVPLAAMVFMRWGLPRRPPRRFPRALAAANAAVVRAEIIVASCSATAARICTVKRFACGKSHATNSTPASMSEEMKWTLRARRSSLAMIRVARCSLQSRSASAIAGRSLRLPLSTSTTSCTSVHLPPLRC